MNPTPETIARAFSGHAFHEAYPYLAEDVRWVLVGGPTLVGKQAAIEACESTLQNWPTPRRPSRSSEPSSAPMPSSSM